MKTIVFKVIKWFLSSFENSTPKASGRKMTACAMTACAIWLHLYLADKDSAFSFLVADLSFISLVLGIVTAQNIIDLKTKK